MKMICYTVLLYCCGLLYVSCTYSSSHAEQTAQKNKEFEEVVTKDTIVEKEKVKQAAIRFFKWHDARWSRECSSKKSSIKIPDFNVLKNKSGQYDGFGNCPCKVDWQSVTTYFNWVRKYDTIISNHYLTYHYNIMKSNEPKLKNASEEDYEFEAVFTDEIFHYLPGQDSPDFCKSGIYGNTTVWEIHLPTDTTANINTTFRLPAEWPQRVMAYSMQMIKEKGSWKLARNLEEGNVSPLYK